GGRGGLHRRGRRERRSGAGGGRGGPGRARSGGGRGAQRRTRRRAAADLARGRAGRGRGGTDGRGNGDRSADIRTGRKEQLSRDFLICIFRQTEYSVAKQTDRIAPCAVRKSSVLSA